ncbi:hypothetical protein H4V95_001157 [Arthrobacter sp. CAN_C5]|nr:hypothetical protein [Arthrobacter sp. CAN_C5]
MSKSTRVDIHGSYRVQAFVAGSWKNRTDRNRCSSIPNLTGARESTSGSFTTAASNARWTSHQDTPNAEAVSDAARPDPITASVRASRSLAVDREYAGTCGVASAKVVRAHSVSSQKNRRLDQMTSTGPAIRMSRIRWNRRECRRALITPQALQPASRTDSTRILRRPQARTSALVTR